jgi:hypothetical protein
MILGRIAGLSEEQIEKEVSSGNLDAILAAVQKASQSLGVQSLNRNHLLFCAEATDVRTDSSSQRPVVNPNGLGEY